MQSLKTELPGNPKMKECLTFRQRTLDPTQPKPFKWMLDVVWLNLVELSKQKTFREILSTVVGAEKEWKKWFDTDSPEEEDIPCGYQVPDRLSFCFLPLPRKNRTQASLDVFRKLLLIRSCCPDRTLAQVPNLTIFTRVQLFSLRHASTFTVPLELISSRTQCLISSICLRKAIIRSEYF